MLNLTPELVLRELKHVPSLNLEGANEYFARGGQLCHVRFVELISEPGLNNVPVSTALLLCHTLTSGAYLTKPAENWLPYNEFHVATIDQLRGLHECALSHVARSRPTNYALERAMSDPDLSGASEIREIRPILHQGEAANPFGPVGTEQMFWSHAGRFYFLQVHIES